MSNAPLPRPTDAELAILRVLWQRGASTVREVHATLARDGGPGYTTVLKLLQIMHDKGLVSRDASARAHVYTPSYSAETTQQQLVGDLLDRAFGGSPGRLVMQALSSRPASEGELRQIRDLLDAMEKENRDESA